MSTVKRERAELSLEAVYLKFRPFSSGSTSIRKWKHDRGGFLRLECSTEHNFMNKVIEKALFMKVYMLHYSHGTANDGHK